MEQVSLANIFVHYNDVQFSKGSFVNRVQIKTTKGWQWMAVPLQNLHLGQRIDEVQIVPAAKWRDRHLELLECSFLGARYACDALELAQQVYSIDYANIGDLAQASLIALVRYFGLYESTRFIDVKEIGITGHSTERVVSIVRYLHGDTYITGHGGLRYLDHNRFEKYNIKVEYMNYMSIPYPQLHGEFNPYVSGLDLVANCGKEGIRYICSKTIDWRSLLNEPHRTI